MRIGSKSFKKRQQSKPFAIGLTERELSEKAQQETRPEVLKFLQKLQEKDPFLPVTKLKYINSAFRHMVCVAICLSVLADDVKNLSGMIDATARLEEDIPHLLSGIIDRSLEYITINSFRFFFR